MTKHRHMTWGEFKKKVEQGNVNDSTEINEICVMYLEPNDHISVYANHSENHTVNIYN